MPATQSGELLNPYIYNYVYNYTDHLGNIRLSYTKDPVSGDLEIMEDNHYYPFGLKHAVFSDIKQKYELVEEEENLARPTYVYETEYQYKYNGKEFQDELGLNMYSMDMRQYDPAIARWVVMDPITHHSMSPYNAFDNNPVYFADPSGADAQSLINEMWNSTEEGTNSHWKRVENDDEDSGDDSQSNDDIRFRDKNGNLIATFETKEIDDDVYLPVEVSEKDQNININVLLKMAGVDLDDIDVIGVGGFWDFTFGMGGGKGIEYVYFLDGCQRGNWQSFIVERGNVGLNGSLGIYGIVGDYYDDSTLTISDYTETSFSVGLAIQGPWISSYGKFWAPKPKISDTLGIKSGFNTDLRSWTGYTVGGGAGAGFQWSKQNTKLYNP